MMVGIPGVNANSETSVDYSFLPRRELNETVDVEFTAMGIIFSVGKGTYSLSELRRRSEHEQQQVVQPPSSVQPSSVVLPVGFGGGVGADNDRRVWCNAHLLQFSILPMGISKVDAHPSVYDVLFPLISVSPIKEGAPYTFRPVVVSYRYTHIYSPDKDGGKATGKKSGRIFIIRVLSVVRLLAPNGGDFTVLAAHDRVLDLAIESVSNSVIRDKLLILADEFLMPQGFVNTKK